jgi:predicted RNase H-like nuclease
MEARVRNSVSRLVGVDGCSGGWVVAQCRPDLSDLSFHLEHDLRPLLEPAISGASIIAIDIPIGLPENEPRACDIAARKLLGRPRGSSVFPTPARRTLTAHTHTEASELNAEALRKAISAQTFNIIPRIREVDGLMTPGLQQYVRECHPEVSFANLNGRPMRDAKHKMPGRIERLLVLQQFQYFGVKLSANRLTDERRRLGVGKLEPDDLLDALVCLVTAFHIYTGRCRSLGLPDQRDAKGLLMEIVT